MKEPGAEALIGPHPTVASTIVLLKQLQLQLERYSQDATVTRFKVNAEERAVQIHVDAGEEKPDAT